MSTSSEPDCEITFREDNATVHVNASSPSHGRIVLTSIIEVDATGMREDHLGEILRSTQKTNVEVNVLRLSSDNDAFPASTYAYLASILALKPLKSFGMSNSGHWGTPPPDGLRKVMAALPLASGLQQLTLGGFDESFSSAENLGSLRELLDAETLKKLELRDGVVHERFLRLLRGNRTLKTLKIHSSLNPRGRMSTMLEALGTLVDENRALKRLVLSENGIEVLSPFFTSFDYRRCTLRELDLSDNSITKRSRQLLADLMSANIPSLTALNARNTRDDSLVLDAIEASNFSLLKLEPCYSTKAFRAEELMDRNVAMRKAFLEEQLTRHLIPELVSIVLSCLEVAQV